MEYALQLAAFGRGRVAPNPLVGAVLVYEDRILGKGYHSKFGDAHAEVNCIQSVAAVDEKYIKDATLYVTLEPCNHHGKTPPCTDLILENKIKKVVIACKDPFEKVNGVGIEMLRNHGVEVVIGVREEEAMFQNRRFFHAIKNHRPYIILKWAETADGFMGNYNEERLYVTNGSLNKLVHTWRSEEAAILVGKGTVEKDDPLLTVRNVVGNNPCRIIVDSNLKLTEKYKVFNEDARTFIFNCHKNEVKNNIEWLQVNENNFFTEMLEILYSRGIQSVLVEGGAQILQAFIDQNIYNEIRRIKSPFQGGDLRAPYLSSLFHSSEEHFGFQIQYYYNKIDA